MADGDYLVYTNMARTNLKRRAGLSVAVLFLVSFGLLKCWNPLLVSFCGNAAELHCRGRRTDSW